jgi:hypothetical protein
MHWQHRKIVSPCYSWKRSSLGLSTALSKCSVFSTRHGLTVNRSEFLDLPPQNSFARLLAHKLADYYSLVHRINEDGTSIRVFKTPTASMYVLEVRPRVYLLTLFQAYTITYTSAIHSRWPLSTSICNGCEDHASGRIRSTTRICWWEYSG